MKNQNHHNGQEKSGLLFSNRLKINIYYIIPIIVFFFIWELVARLELVNPLLFPPPSAIWLALKEWWFSGELWRDVKASYWRMLAGFFIGGSLGVLLGMFTGRSKIIHRCFTPIIQFIRPLPPVAIIPLVIVWLGIGNAAKIFSISFAVFFPVWINTHLGAISIAPVYLWSARLLTKSRFKKFFQILIPATLPSIMAGLRTSIAIAFIMVYVSEIAGASQGVGYQISVSHLAYRIDKMMAALFVLALAGVIADFLFAKMMRFIFPWIEMNQNK
jgi:ABC-type nitrate/sulfonate/bicarbonate transport system permease component